MDIAAILFRRYASTAWTLNGDDYAGLTWLSEGKAPTEKQLEALWPEVLLELQTERVERARAAAYRKTSDSLFFQYQRGTVTEQAWLDAVQAVKDAHPYPEA